MESQPINLLIVDDDELDRELIERGLRKAKVANPVTMAGDGQEALDILRGTGDRPPLPSPFIVILDWNMPRMGGLEFLEEIRKDEELRTSTIFVLTTSKDGRDQQSAYEHLVAGYIVKEKVGQDFVELITLLDAYWRIVELPA